MEHVLTLAFAAPVLDDPLRQLAEKLPGGTLTRLGDSAADLHFAGPTSVAAPIMSALTHAPVDQCLQPAGPARRKRLLVADMDSTMIGQECIDELAASVGIGPDIAAITEQAMRGELDFEAALRARVARLRGVPAATIEDIIRTRLTLTPGGATLVHTMNAHGAVTALVSGGFDVFVARIAARLGFACHYANTLGVDAAGLLDGTVADPILGRAAKRATLEALAAREGLTNADAVAIGDGANDIDLITAAGLGLAFRAKPVLEAAAHAAIRHTDLRTALYFQGYADREMTH